MSLIEEVNSKMETISALEEEAFNRLEKYDKKEYGNEFVQKAILKLAEKKDFIMNLYGIKTSDINNKKIISFYDAYIDYLNRKNDPIIYQVIQSILGW